MLVLEPVEILKLDLAGPVRVHHLGVVAGLQQRQKLAVGAAEERVVQDH